MAKREYCIIGIDGFSLEIARQLKLSGAKVVLVDIDQEKVDSLASKYEYVFRADATNLASLQDLNVEQFTAIIVGAGIMETSIVVVSNLLQLKVKNIVAKVKSEIQKKVLSILGGNNVHIVWPEESAAQSIAFRLLHNIDLNSIDNAGISIIQIPVQRESMFGIPIKNFETKSRFSATIIMINRENDIIFPVHSTTELLRNDIITIACRSDMTDEVVNLFVHNEN